MINLIQSVVLMDNSELSTTTFAQLPTAENLQSITVQNCQAKTGFRLQYMYLQNCQELTTLVLTNTLGIDVADVNSTNKGVPSNWATLTKLTTINMANCGFTASAVDAVIKGLSEVVNAGLGAAILTGKTLLINQQNARPTLTNQAVLDAKNNLIAKGWTVTHN